MKNLSEIDKNFQIKTTIEKTDIRFIDARETPFEINGIFYADGKFCRMPQEIAERVNEGVQAFYSNTAGGRVRFKTNSPYIAIHAKMSGIGKMPHFTLCGSAGFDLYVKDKYKGSFLPPFSIEEGYESVIELGEKKWREITINFPLYSNVNELYIGISNRGQLAPPTPYKKEMPIVYYGSSITQGGCASRPGNSYESIISRALNADYINLGFSGSARGEESISTYICSLPMSVFVYDYDHNAPTIEHLACSHERMFKEFRKAQPTTPVVILSRPTYYPNAEERNRLKIIKKTYENALASGDKNVYFIDGKTLMREAKGEGTVDGCHPTDLGFYSMAKALLKVLKKLY
ncbi:MAG: hypothetical protein E7368_03090 [Clostridiales bacterium]|nr:hypothetical protein [Clostridiales bacterium]